MGKVLILENDDDLKDLIFNSLKDNGHECVIAHNTLNAFRIINNSTIDAAIIDCTPPNISGYELLFEIRKSKPLLPVILTSAGFVDLKTDENSCLLMKPYDLDKIFLPLANSSN